MPQPKSIIIVDCYTVPVHQHIHVFEFKINATSSDFKVRDFNQKLPNTDRMSWQAPLDESFLDNRVSKLLVTGEPRPNFRNPLSISILLLTWT